MDALSLELSQSSFRLALRIILMLFFHGTARERRTAGYQSG